MSTTTIVITVMAIIIALLVGFIGWAVWSVATEPDAPQPEAPPSPTPEEVRRQLIAQQQAETDAYYRGSRGPQGPVLPSCPAYFGRLITPPRRRAPVPAHGVLWIKQYT